ncbi:MAG TPA: PVC-type heme-binding CxxCH protein [Pirellulales bacterium]|jgi:putative heme-binding domain-containing protein|nr:PVC-type heme-binding CxxCH protein [Pirellulales bacterium]
MKLKLFALALLLSAVFADFNFARAQALELKKGDHICYVGNTLADRMQHFGWLETLLYDRFPDQQLVFRDLGFAADEVELNARMRSAGFGSPDEWLTKEKADVIFAFFGYNESFADQAGVEHFKSDLDQWVKATLAKKYNGTSAPRIVIFSPIAHEDLKDRNLPDGKENNRRIQLYTSAMYDVAKAHNLPFVDLYSATKELYAAAQKPLTINGVHMNELGDKTLAPKIVQSLFPKQAEGKLADEQLDKLRRAVLDKNFCWFERYRTTDGYSIYGGRADLKFVNGQTNRIVAQREMEILDEMTGNRDKKIWAVAQGQDFKVDDSNTEPFIDVITNLKGRGPNGEHIFLSGDEAVKKMTAGPHMKVNLFASEEMFPELVNPVQMAWDTKGRLWVAAWSTYPHWKPKDEMNDKLLILEDTNGDGKADKCTIFADHLTNPTGFQFYNGGVLIAQAPDLMYLKDSTGGDHCDTRVRVLDGLDTADTHHTSNSFVLDPGGALYFQEGTFMRTQVESPYGPPQRLADAGVNRYEPRTQKFEVYVSYGFANPHGHIFDRWGEDFVTDGTGAVNYFAAAFSGHVDFPRKHPGVNPYFQQRTRPCPGTEILSSRQFPPENQGNLLIANVIGVQGILQYKYEDAGSGFTAHEVEPIVTSTDPNFRPAAMEIGPDGAIYFCDWQNPVIGHMQHNLRDPSRDHTHGRVYRVAYEGRPLLKPVKIAGEPIEKLLDLLKEPEDRVRSRAKIELGGRDSEAVIAALNKWVAGLDKADPQYQHNLLEALWVHQYHNMVDEALLKQLLASPDFHARAAATRVLCYWRDRIPGALDLLRTLAADEHPRVRLEAVRAASFFTEPEAIEIALITQEHPTDYFLDYTRNETMKQLEPYWKAAVAAGKPIAVKTDAGARFFIRNVSTEKLLTMEKTPAVALELLFRPGLRDEQRRDGLAALAKSTGKSEVQVLLEEIKAVDNKRDLPDESVVFDLARLLIGRKPAELKAIRADIERLATSAKRQSLRQVGYVILIGVDGATDNAWKLALHSPAALADLASALPFVPDLSARASLYAKVEPLLHGLPAEFANGGKETLGQYVRIELPGRSRTLTLAEVEAFSGGHNVARGGKASQKNTAYGGVASRGIDGNKSSNYNEGGETHTEENTDSPWWEVDLGREYPLESIVVYNRVDGDLGKRLSGFTLTVYDHTHNHVVFKKEKNPTPNPSETIAIGPGNAETIVRRAAMQALVSVRGEETKTFKSLAQFVRKDIDRTDAIQAIQRIPVVNWDKAEAQPLIDILIKHVSKLSTEAKTSAAALDELQFADSLASLLPPEQAKKTRAELTAIGVRVIRVNTLPERMSFDKDVIVVKAGQPVQIIFENADLMPHNMVIAQPGSLEEIGLAGEAQAQAPDAAARQYIPHSNKILLASRLIQPRDSQQLTFTPPSQPGVYPIVCTYPGHWRRMYSALYVVNDLDAYLENPEAYLAKANLPIKDELLKDRRPRTEWKLADLLNDVQSSTAERNLSNGKHLFTVAACISCHKLDGVGNTFGPDLAKLEPDRFKNKPADILKDVLEPSFRINEKFQSYQFRMNSGKVVTGLIIEEKDGVVKVVENPLLSREPTILKAADIDERLKSPVSLMPKGLLDKLTKEEILDLMAYVRAPHQAEPSK